MTIRQMEHRSTKREDQIKSGFWCVSCQGERKISALDFGAERKVLFKRTSGHLMRMCMVLCAMNAKWYDAAMNQAGRLFLMMMTHTNSDFLIVGYVVQSRVVFPKRCVLCQSGCVPEQRGRNRKREITTWRDTGTLLLVAVCVLSQFGRAHTHDMETRAVSAPRPSEYNMFFTYRYSTRLRRHAFAGSSLPKCQCSSIQ